MSGVRPESSRGSGWDLEEIRRKADIVELISPHVRLRKAGRRLTGLCPFHQERTPSFTVDPEKGLWHCFGCKAGGDVFRFVEMTEKVDFQEAVELLARRLGLPPRTPAAASQSRAKERLIALHERAARFFSNALKGRTGAGALEYLKKRGVSTSSIETFMLGYAPDQWDSLLNAMDKHGFPGKEVARAGLAIQRDDGGFYDRFRNRLMFPIRDTSGWIIAFGGRALADDQQPKYLNSPETTLFQKGQTLWAFDLARRAMADKGHAIVVEGYMDAIACHEAGFTETVATMGTALTTHHVELLRRRTDRLVLAFDADSAGLAAATRSTELFRQAELDVRVLTLPEGMDPDNVIREKGANAFRELADSALPMIEWELDRALSRGKGGREGMAALRDAVAILARVPSGVEREYYTGWLARKTAEGEPGQLRTTESAIRDELLRQPGRKEAHGRRSNDAPSQQPSTTERVVVGLSERHLFTRLLLAALIQHGELAAQYVPMLVKDDFPTAEEQALFEAIGHLADQGEEITTDTILAGLEPQARGLLAELSLDKAAQEQAAGSLGKNMRRVVEARLVAQRQDLKRRLSQPISKEEDEAIRHQLKEIEAQKSELAAPRIVDDS